LGLLIDDFIGTLLLHLHYKVDNSSHQNYAAYNYKSNDPTGKFIQGTG